LPGSHPSARPTPDWADADYGERGDEEWWRPAEPEAADTEPDEADDVLHDADDVLDDVPPGDDPDSGGVAGEPGEASRPAAPDPGGRRPEASADWGELGGLPARSPYRPWFSAEGAADPWFAAREIEHGEAE
jgi:hypothetical protein